MNKKKFFDVIRKDLYAGKIDASVVKPFDTLLDAFEARGIRVEYMAYMLATAFHETNKTMLPVREAYWLSENWRSRNLRYYPYYGRGFVQLTWKPNYEKADRILNLNGALTKNLDLAMELDIATEIMIQGMLDGWFTGKKLSDYHKKGGYDYEQARRIINGTDAMRKIAGYAMIFEKALT